MEIFCILANIKVNILCDVVTSNNRFARCYWRGELSNWYSYLSVLFLTTAYDRQLSQNKKLNFKDWGKKYHIFSDYFLVRSFPWNLLDVKSALFQFTSHYH